MTLTEEQIELFIKYKPDIVWFGKTDKYKDGYYSYEVDGYTSGKQHIDNLVNNFRNDLYNELYCNTIIQAIKLVQFNDEMQEIINGET